MIEILFLLCDEIFQIFFFAFYAYAVVDYFLVSVVLYDSDIFVFLKVFLTDRQFNNERTALVFFAFHRYLSVMGFHDIE